MKKVIKVNFCDFGPDFVWEKSIIYKALSKKYKLTLSEKPDFLFYSCFSNQNNKFSECIKISFIEENVVPDFNKCDYAISPHYITFDDRHFRYCPAVYDEKLRLRNIDNPENRKFCNFIYFNINSGAGAIIRSEFCKKLSEYKHVDCPGYVLNNMKNAIEPRNGNWRKGKQQFIKDYKFTIAFENTCNNGYTTEKLTDAFISYSIHIYWGNPLVTRDFNPKAFINCNDFSSFDEVIEYVKFLDNNDSLYLEMLNSPPLLFNPEQREKELENFLYNIIEKGNKPFQKNLFYTENALTSKKSNSLGRRMKNFIRKHVLQNK